MGALGSALRIAVLLAAAFVLPHAAQSWPESISAVRVDAEFLPVAAPPPERFAPGPPHPRLAKLGTGRILVASRRLTGPFFSEAVVLLLDYDVDGAIGVVLNRRTPVPLPHLLPEIAKLGHRRDPVFLGGPVDARRMVFLIRSEAPPADSRHVVADVHATGSAEVLRRVIANDTPSDRFRAYVGYAGWAPGQLAAEVERGDWFVEDAAPSLIFDDSVGDLWKRLIAGHEGVHVRAVPSPDPLHGAALR